MKYLYIYLIIFVTSAFLAAGCSELQDDVASGQPVSRANFFHPEGFEKPGSPNFHGKYIKEHNYEMRDCQQCHGANYTGGRVNAACTDCHTQQNGPEACNTCHGDSNPGGRIYPPRDLDDNTTTASRGVGAHEQHLGTTVLGARARCSSCHIFPRSTYAPGHIDSTRYAEVNFGGIAANFHASPQYDASNQTCANTYCHGGFEFRKSEADSLNRFAYTADKMTGNPQTVSWTNPTGAEKTCGTCHGLPPAGHIPASINQCYQCHGNVVDMNGNIIDKDKHINGMVNARGSSAN